MAASKNLWHFWLRSAQNPGCVLAACQPNRQDFSHCNANVKSLLDGVLRRGSGSVKVELGGWSRRSWADVLET